MYRTNTSISVWPFLTPDVTTHLVESTAQVEVSLGRQRKKASLSYLLGMNGIRFGRRRRAKAVRGVMDTHHLPSVW